MAKPKAIPDSEWRITIQLTVGPDDTPIGAPTTLRYSNSTVSSGAMNVATLIAGRLDEYRERIAPLAKKAGKR
jgi:hypothetical protein